jgi:DNA transposition AAA+ family ATPase
MTSSESISQPAIQVLPPCRDLSIGVEAVIADIVTSLRSGFIETEYAKYYFKTLDNYRKMGQGVRVIGPRLSGKSKASRRYGELTDKKTAYSDVPSNCSSRRMHERLLRAMRHADPGGRRTDVQSKLNGCITPFGYEMIIVDQGEKLQKEALEDLAVLMGKKGIPVVVCGTPALDQYLEDIGLLDWFPNLFSFDSLNSVDFIQTLQTIENEYLRLPEPSNLATGENFQTLAIYTHSYIGIIINIVEKAVVQSLQKGHFGIDSSILKQVSEKYGKRYVDPKLVLQAASSGSSMQSPPALPS